MSALQIRLQVRECLNDAQAEPKGVRCRHFPVTNLVADRQHGARSEPDQLYPNGPLAMLQRVGQKIVDDLAHMADVSTHRGRPGRAEADRAPLLLSEQAEVADRLLDDHCQVKHARASHQAPLLGLGDQQ